MTLSIFLSGFFEYQETLWSYNETIVLFQGRKNVIRIIREIIKNRRASLKAHDDMLNSLLANVDPRYELNDEEIDDQIIMILNSGYETISTTTMMAIKYLHDHPEALQELRVFLSSHQFDSSSL